MPRSADKAREDRDHYRKLLRRREARVDELVEARNKLNREIKEKIERRKEKRAEGKGEALADEIEELKDYRDRLDERIADKRAEAKFFRRRFRGAKRALKRARKRARGRPSPNFTYAEFDCRDGTKIPSGSKPAVKAWCQEYGERLRSRFGAVHITSGYRHRAYNASIGGASNSVHIYDLHLAMVAGDFWCDRGSPREWADALEEIADGLGRYSSFVHADNRNRYGWSNARWSG